MIIDLGKQLKSGSKVFSGRNRGAEVRHNLNLDNLDTNPDIIYIKIPKDTFSLNASFFLGTFGPSVRKLGKEGFNNKYKFECEDIIKQSIEDSIERALKSTYVLRNEK